MIPRTIIKNYLAYNKQLLRVYKVVKNKVCLGQNSQNILVCKKRLFNYIFKVLSSGKWRLS